MNSCYEHAAINIILYLNRGSAQKFLSGGLKVNMLCVILGYIAHVSVIYVRIVLVGFERVLIGF